MSGLIATMQTFETSDANLVRRCKRSQFSGKPLDGAYVCGDIHPVVEATPAKWVVTFTPKDPPIIFAKEKPKARW
jgi:hypothetical protein